MPPEILNAEIEIRIPVVNPAGIGVWFLVIEVSFPGTEVWISGTKVSFPGTGVWIAGTKVWNLATEVSLGVAGTYSPCHAKTFVKADDGYRDAANLIRAAQTNKLHVVHMPTNNRYAGNAPMTINAIVTELES